MSTKYQATLTETRWIEEQLKGAVLKVKRSQNPDFPFILVFHTKDDCFFMKADIPLRIGKNK